MIYIAINPKHSRLEQNQGIPCERNVLSSQEVKNQQEVTTVSNSEKHSRANDSKG